VDFGLEIKFDADREHGVLELAVGRDRAAEEIACVATSCQSGDDSGGGCGKWRRRRQQKKLTNGAVSGAGKAGQGGLDEGVGGHLHPHVHVGRGLLVLLGSGDIGGLGGPVFRSEVSKVSCQYFDGPRWV
jgi:hypothetical protein